jgi:hypothetical protein
MHARSILRRQMARLWLISRSSVSTTSFTPTPHVGLRLGLRHPPSPCPTPATAPSATSVGQPVALGEEAMAVELAALDQGEGARASESSGGVG